jgi:hypothetical protein
MLVLALFLLMAVVSTASCFAELSYLMQSNAIGTCQFGLRNVRPKAHSPALVDIPPRTELAGLYRLSFLARFALPFKAMMNGQPIKNGRLFQSDHLRSIQP